jgi:hypothetical protein
MAEAGSIEQLIEEYAGRAVTTARSAHVTLDFSEASLERLEQLLEEAAPGDLEDAAKMWGAYFGEVVRRRWGGEWSVETYPGAQFATLTLTVLGSKLFPSMKIYRRLTQGASENVATFYASIKERLGKAPAPRVN